MNRMIKKLSESPCYQCGCRKRCTKKIQKTPILDEIRSSVFSNPSLDYHKCGIWIALNAPEIENK